MSKFKVGDRVRRRYDSSIGTVVEAYPISAGRSMGYGVEYPGKDTVYYEERFLSLAPPEHRDCTGCKHEFEAIVRYPLTVSIKLEDEFQMRALRHVVGFLKPEHSLSLKLQLQSQGIKYIF